MAGAEAGQGAQTIIRPQARPQTQFLSSAADIAIYGGSAGGGKTFGLLLEPIRHVHVPGFGGVIFRRNLVQVRNEGGLWDESEKLYPLLQAKPKIAPDLSWTFPAGTALSFGHHVTGFWSPSSVETLIKNTATADGVETEISLPQDPGQAGKSQVTNLIKLLSGFVVRARRKAATRLR